MLEDVKKTIREIQERDPEFNLAENCNPWISMLQAFLNEWDQGA
jgi:hypothetical protein